jgi:ABC-type nickel/cobalt efflux system permease component RcnA
MLGSIALNRVVFGLVLIVCFSAGLAATLVAIGLLMVYSGRTAGRLRLFDRLGASRAAGLARVARVAPALSAGVVALAGLALTVEAARQIDLPRLWSHSPAFRTLAANGLSVVVGALAVWVALRRSAARSQPAPAPVPAHTAPLHAAPAPHAPVRGHAHVHAHAHAHSHPHVYPHHHVHDDHAHETGVRENAAISKN